MRILNLHIISESTFATRLQAQDERSTVKTIELCASHIEGLGEAYAKTSPTIGNQIQIALNLSAQSLRNLITRMRTTGEVE